MTDRDSTTRPSDAAGRARYYTMRDDGQLECQLCPRHCRLSEGQRAFCFVRERRGDEMVLTTWGRSTGFCVDPIEKKPLNHFLPGSSVLSFGTAGCNLGCRFCQNWSISKSREVASLSDDATPDEIAAAAARVGARSVAFTYNDPVIWAEYAIDTARACKERGIATVAVTAGYITETARADFFEHIDAANIDLKAFTEHFYHKLAFAHLEPVLETMRWLRHETDVWFEITNLVIPGHNDSADEIAKMVDWVLENLGPNVPMHFSAFHPDFKMKDVPRTPPSTLTRCRQQALDAGLHYAYTGNVHDPAGDTTWCPGCGAAVIERDWYELHSYRVTDGGCAACGTPIAGRLTEQPGTWGRRRLPVRIAR